MGDNVMLEKCVEDILAQIKPVEDDRSRRLSTILELENCVHSLASLTGASVKPFGSFVSDLFSNSGDLDLSLQLVNGSSLSTNKKKKQIVLREVRKALLIRGVAGNMQFIPHARVPVLQYVSKRFGISCDISVNNYAGRIKSKIFYWVNTLDERFGDTVLLIKEWAKAQNINDPKSGSLNSYSLCLLVLFHFQTTEPAILPPLKEIYGGNITEDIAEGAFYNEEHLDELCAANIARFQLQNKGQRNESSLCHLLATFFQKFTHISALPDNVISTYTGKIEKIQDNPSWMTKSYHLFVEDPVERPDNAARAVSMKGLQQIASAFNDAHRKFGLQQIASAFNDAHRKFVSLEHIDRNGLLALLCTPGVGSKLGARIMANSYTKNPQRNNQHSRSGGRDQSHQVSRGFTGNRSLQKNPQANTTAHQTSVQYQNSSHPQVHSTARQTARSYHSRNHPQAYNSGHQTAQHQNHNHQQVYYSRPQSAGPYQNHNQQDYPTVLQSEAPYQIHNQPYATGFHTAGPHQRHDQVYPSGFFQSTGAYQNQQVYSSGFQSASPYQNQQRGKEYTSSHHKARHAVTARYQRHHQARHAVTARYQPVRGQWNNGSTLDSLSAASNNAASQR